MERLCHHFKFLTSCQNKGIIPKGLMLDKSRNPMWAHSTEGIAELRSEINDASKQIMAKLITYFEEAVVKEQDILQSLNDKLTEIILSPHEHPILDSFQVNISLKKEAIRTKLEKRRANKIEKLIKPTEEHHTVRADLGLPKMVRKSERRIHLRANPGENNNKKPTNKYGQYKYAQWLTHLKPCCRSSVQ